MQLSLDNNGSVLIRAYQPGELLIGEDQFHGPLIVTPDAVHGDWSPTAIAELSIADFEPVLAHQPEVVLFGTGPTQQFPPLALISAVMSRGVGFEVMDTAAASRTFNVLAGEGRRVVAALLID